MFSMKLLIAANTSSGAFKRKALSMTIEVELKYTQAK